MPSSRPLGVTARDPPSSPATQQQPKKAMIRARSFCFVIFSRQNRAESSTTKVGAVYSRMADTAREETCWLLK